MNNHDNNSTTSSVRRTTRRNPNDIIMIPTFQDVWPILNKKLNVKSICGFYVVAPRITSSSPIPEERSNVEEPTFNNYKKNYDGSTTLTFEEYLKKNYNHEISNII